MSAILKEEPAELQVTNPHIAPRLDHIVRYCLEKNPEDRFQSARDLLFDLKEIVAAPAAAVPAALAPRRRRWRRAALAGATVLVAAGVLAYVMRPREGEALDSLAVLPFLNTSGGDTDLQYVSEGITESLIDALSKLPSLRRVIARVGRWIQRRERRRAGRRSKAWSERHLDRAHPAARTAADGHRRIGERARQPASVGAKVHAHAFLTWRSSRARSARKSPRVCVSKCRKQTGLDWHGSRRTMPRRISCISRVASSRGISTRSRMRRPPSNAWNRPSLATPILRSRTPASPRPSIA